MIRSFTDDEIKSHLVAEGMCSKEASEQIAPLADGNMREAYRMIDQVQDQNTLEVRDWYRECYSLKIGELLKRSEEFTKKDKEAQKSYFLTGINVLREVMLSKSQVNTLMRSGTEERDFIEKMGANVLDEKKISDMYTKLNEAHYHLERNANAKILFTDLSFQLAKIIRRKQGV
jgi:DNA polymerase-3 subunit delta'